MDKIEPTVQSLLVSAVAFLFCIIPAAFEYPVSSLLLLDLKGWVSILWYGLIVTMLSYVLWYAGIKRCTAHTAAAFSCLMPFTSMLLAFLILKESIETMQWIGGSLVILGVILLADSQAAEKG
nr:DMT family transporter [Pelosinus baikalensis]